jgi:hypothetical protein
VTGTPQSTGRAITAAGGLPLLLLPYKMTNDEHDDREQRKRDQDRRKMIHEPIPHVDPSFSLNQWRFCGYAALRYAFTLVSSFVAS